MIPQQIHTVRCIMLQQNGKSFNKCTKYVVLMVQKCTQYILIVLQQMHIRVVRCNDAPTLHTVRGTDASSNVHSTL